jgi:hypothetical protein
MNWVTRACSLTAPAPLYWKCQLIPSTSHHFPVRIFCFWLRICQETSAYILTAALQYTPNVTELSWNPEVFRWPGPHCCEADLSGIVPSLWWKPGPSQLLCRHQWPMQHLTPTLVLSPSFFRTAPVPGPDFSPSKQFTVLERYTVICFEFTYSFICRSKEILFSPQVVS